MKSGIKVIYQSHNGSAETFAGKNVPKSILNLIRNYQRKKLLSLNTTNIQVSDVAGEWMFGPDYDVKNTYVNGIQLDGFEFSFKKREELRKRYNISNNARVVLMASRIVEQKNVFRSLRISETGVDESDFDFAFFIGEGPLSEKLSNQISKLNKVMQSRIFYEGVQKDMQAWFSFADVLLMPSYYEGLPYTAIEAQANGLPVVLSESITRQVKVTSLTHYVSLDSSDHTWANTIASSIRADDRKKYNERLANSAYSMMNFSQKFDLLYQKQ
ncbi:glycosyltransferase [Lactiplantibacillus carotarum]|uniref:glycosyltransferase n=1 Tax=Lactiplantibacillus carotarum TaxID=2993456 RepID=UPI00298F255D|nr:glycosyltransferase [Lactiplantibacillus carotarum]